jgi:colanic acid/amylovoran biosynthesis protein
MHSNIFALSQGVPVLAIGYLHKTRGIMRMVGLEDWVIDIDKITPNSLEQMLEAIWRKRTELHTHIMEQLPSLTLQAKQPGVLIATDYYKTGKGLP